MGKLVRCITSDGAVMATAVDTTDIVAQSERFHKTSAVCTAALGRLLTAASMMGDMLKGENDTLMLRIDSDGPIKNIVAVSDSSGNVRGYMKNGLVEIPLNSKGKLDVGSAVGAGTLFVSKNLGLKEPYNGQVQLVSGEIAEDITSYYAVSEQIPTVCALGVLVNPDLTVKSAGGYIIQLLPGADDATIDKLEAAIKGMEPVSKMLADGKLPEDMIRLALNGFETEVLYEGKTAYKCNCSRKRTESILRSLGKEELTKIANEQPVTEVVCHFCDETYKFTSDEIRKFIK